MSNALVFSNSGEIDLRVFSLFGASIKPSSQNPFGKFGTGLKHALAGAIRLGCQVNIFVGATQFQVAEHTEVIRGKEIRTIWLDHIGSQMNDISSDDIRLPFSSSLGHHWAEWMVLREFYTNMFDEGDPSARLIDKDDLYLEEFLIPSQTTFVIQGEALTNLWAVKDLFFLPYTPKIWAKDFLAIEPGLSAGRVYYRGIAITHETAPYANTYSFLTEVPLSEDRLVANSIDMERRIVEGIVASTNEQVFSAISDDKSCREFIFDFNRNSVSEVSDEFARFFFEKIASRLVIPRGLRSLLARVRPTRLAEVEEYKVPTGWADMIENEPKVAFSDSDRKIDFYGLIRSFEDEITGLKRQIRWWKACAKAANTGEEVTVPLEEIVDTKEKESWEF